MRDAIRCSLIAAVAFCASFAMAADVTKRIQVPLGAVELRLDSVPANAMVKWDVRQPLDLKMLGPYENKSVLIVDPEKAGQLIVHADVVEFESKQWDTTRFIITVGQGPEPPPVPDPTPTPTPTPTDVVTPAPIQLPGLRVLIVYESLDAPPRVPRPQYDAMFEQRIRDWMTANCAVGAANTAEWRMIDKDDLFVGEGDAHWKAASMRPRRSLPWVLISNGTTNRGYEGPVPENGDKFLELLQRFK